MNFLAHLKLAEATPESRLGNWLGDFVKGLPWDDRFDDAIWQGIMEHRHLDVFTDNHLAWKRSRDRLAPENRRYAGIVIDIFYDFFLTKNWEKFDDQPLEQFIDEVHKDLQSVENWVPRDSKSAFGRMIRQQWLAGYGNFDGVAKTLKRVADVSPRLATVGDLETELETNMEGFEADFLEFFPDALTRVEEIRKDLRESRLNKKNL